MYVHTHTPTQRMYRNGEKNVCFKVQSRISHSLDNSSIKFNHSFLNISQEKYQ